jgi:hypothetical protein
MLASAQPGSDPFNQNEPSTITGTGGVGAVGVVRSRRRFCDRMAHHVRTMLLTRLLGLLS